MPSKTFSPGTYTWDVPKNVEWVDVDLRGGGSGSTPGGRVAGRMRVKDTQKLYILVGEAGHGASGSQGGVGGVGRGGNGGDGGGGLNGGASGAGGSWIRLTSATGTIKAVAGGAGGKSGDNGPGGQGGASTGEHGFPGTSGSGSTGNATGGSQTQGGKGGNSAAGSAWSGHDASNNKLSNAGNGGQRTGYASHGGGGGGGGYYSGGGGQASLQSANPGGGGGGGSSFTGGLTSNISNLQGGGGTGAGQVILTWNTPPPANQPPGVPSDMKIDGRSESPEMATKSKGRVEISAVVRDNDSTTVDPVHDGDPATQVHGKVRLVVQLSTQTDGSPHTTYASDLVESGKRATVVITGLTDSTLYHVRAYAQDTKGLRSDNFNGGSFWTNRAPTEPTLQAPPDNGTVLSVDTVTFDWAHHDPDPSDSQTQAQVRWRTPSTHDAPAGPWITRTIHGAQDTYFLESGTLKPNIYYDWTVRTRDEQGAYGPWAIPRSLFVLGVTIPPRPLHPNGGEAIEVNENIEFSWKFRDPLSANHQLNADLRFRAVHTDDWITYIGTGVTGQTWSLEGITFEPGVNYEWQVRTYRTSDSLPSDWSDSATFWAIAPLGNVPTVVVDPSFIAPPLGIGNNRAFIYDRGGMVIRGEITPISQLTWSRKRDDLGEATVTTIGFGEDCADLLRNTHTWLNELVIFRDGERVFEGPITLITDSTDGFTIQAKDVMGYVYRRVMKQGYNDSYHLVNGQAEGLLTVVKRATLIIANALARNDPNVLPYLTPLEYDDDARQSRVVPDYSKTAWEDVDDMAANSGLDYSVIGRRIILNDTHRPVGRLPEMRAADFSQPPIISEYGMLLADEYVVTDGLGHWGSATAQDSPYGGIELLVSSFSETGTGGGEALTKQKTAQLTAALSEQARRGIASRYPAPYIVRVPDQTRLMPHVPVGINQLVPGVWIPLRAEGTAIEIAQWQKLDVVTCMQASDDEQIMVTMSAAPNRGEDPDAGGGDEAVDAT